MFLMVSPDLIDTFLLADFTSEPLGLLIFGFILIALAISLRWFFGNGAAEKSGASLAEASGNALDRSLAPGLSRMKAKNSEK